MRVFVRDINLGVPILLAEEHDEQLHAWCSYCFRYHKHGIDSINSVVLAHCINPYSPYLKTNYLLKVKDDLDKNFDYVFIPESQYINNSGQD